MSLVLRIAKLLYRSISFWVAKKGKISLNFQLIFIFRLQAILYVLVVVLSLFSDLHTLFKTLSLAFHLKLLIFSSFF